MTAVLLRRITEDILKNLQLFLVKTDFFCIDHAHCIETFIGIFYVVFHRRKNVNHDRIFIFE